MRYPSYFRVSTTRGRRPGPTGAAGPGGDWPGQVNTYPSRPCGKLGPLRTRSGKSGRAAARISSVGCSLWLVAWPMVADRTCRYSWVLESESAGWHPNLVRGGAASLGLRRAGSFSIGSDLSCPWPGPWRAADCGTAGDWTASRRAGTQT